MWTTSSSITERLGAFATLCTALDYLDMAVCMHPLSFELMDHQGTFLQQIPKVSNDEQVCHKGPSCGSLLRCVFASYLPPVGCIRLCLVCLFRWHALAFPDNTSKAVCVPVIHCCCCPAQTAFCYFCKLPFAVTPKKLSGHLLSHIWMAAFAATVLCCVTSKDCYCVIPLVSVAFAPEC